MPTDEQNRQKFEEAIRSRYAHASMSFERDDVGGYVNRVVHDHWEGWQARDAEVQALREALRDMLSGWHYIRAHHGDLYGVGWERAQTKAETALAGGETGETE